MKKRTLIIFILAAIALISACQVDTSDSQSTNQLVDLAESVDEANEISATVIHLTDANYHENVDNASGLYFVDFWAEWCAPCQELGPILEEISAEEGITVYKVDVDDCPNTANEFQIAAIPMVYLYKDGQVVDSQMGAGYKQLYLDMLEKYK